MGMIFLRYEDAAVRGGSTLNNSDGYSSRALFVALRAAKPEHARLAIPLWRNGDSCLLILSDMLSFVHSFYYGPSTDCMQVELRAKAQRTTSR